MTSSSTFGVLLSLCTLLAGSGLAPGCPPTVGCEGSCRPATPAASHACCESGGLPSAATEVGTFPGPARGGCTCADDVGDNAAAVLAGGAGGRVQLMLEGTAVAGLTAGPANGSVRAGSLPVPPPPARRTPLFLATAALLI